jgi:O-antigen ligase
MKTISQRSGLRMPLGPVTSVVESSENLQGPGLWIPLMFIWLLMLLSFSAPGREGDITVGSLDAVALGKLAVRLFGLTVLGLTIGRSWRHPRRRAVVRCLWPLGLYVGWSVLSILWSPLKSISFGQAGGLLLQGMLAFVVGLRCTGERDRSMVLQNLFLAMLAFSLVILIINVITPELSGLQRVSFEDWEGFVHPTTAGATASLALVILIAARLLWGWRWTGLWLVPGLLIQGAQLVLSRSRTAMAMGVATVLLSLLLFSRKIVFNAMVVIIGLGLTGYMVLDPGLALVDRGLESVSEFARRGETDEQMQSFNGRTKLWGVIWDEFLRSPIIGHGYFVTSRTGSIDVWQPEHPSNKTAHNVLLQVFASTGLVGGILFLWGLIRPLATYRQSLSTDLRDRRLAAFLGILGIWYVGWGCLSESFMGPVAPESLAFFTLLGLAIGSLPADGKAR